jgi:predicted ArsR family transcriptional regulator
MQPTSDSPDVRDAILLMLKQEGALPITVLSERLAITYEAVRQHLIALEREELVVRRVQRPKEGSVGRPSALYSLTVAGDHLFPKEYDGLASVLIGAVEEKLGDGALATVLAAITDAQVGRFESIVRTRTLERRLDALRAFYRPDDPFMSWRVEDDVVELVERNCPFLNVALQRPELCSTSVSALSRLFGYQVARTERFQNGDRRCVFRVLLDEPVDPDRYGYRPEPSP